eukprot:GEMP01032237.1.p1 GENE.GEMP01032237.1~~GEMP01032237.1.p1  ORF type:complete len:322 (+),score=41.65 GEMP01032237.1:154-1119(+)
MLDIFLDSNQHAADGHLTFFNESSMMFKPSSGERIPLDDSSEAACRLSCRKTIHQYYEANPQGIMSALKSSGEKVDTDNCEIFCYDSFSTSVCFAGDSSVAVRGRGNVLMAELNVGDFVLTPKGFEEVLCWIHRNQTKDAKFLEIGYEGGSICLSGYHYIMAANGSGYKAKPAGELTLDDQLRIMWCDMSVRSSPIKSIRTVIKRGFFAPLTYSGTLFVDNVYSSCYAIPKLILETPFMQMLSDCHLAAHAAMLPLRWYYRNVRKLSKEEGNASEMNEFCQLWLSAYSSLCGVDATMLQQKPFAFPSPMRALADVIGNIAV